jgi:hypothetical protein
MTSTIANLTNLLSSTYEVCVWKVSGNGFQVVYQNDHTHFIDGGNAINELLDEGDSLDRICDASQLAWARHQCHSLLNWKVGAVKWRNSGKLYSL